MRRRIRASLGLSCVAVAAVVWAAPQDPPAPPQQPPPVFRGGVTLVNVDVYPRRDGKLVEGRKKIGRAHV